VRHLGLPDLVAQLLLRENDVGQLVLVVLDSEELLLHLVLWLLEGRISLSSFVLNLAIGWWLLTGKGVVPSVRARSLVALS